MTAEPTRERCQDLLTDKKVLPTGLSLRFAVLVLVIVATSATVYGHLSLLAESGAEATARTCLGRVPAGAATGAGATPLADVQCLRRFTGSMVVWSLVGVILVVSLTLLLYLAQQWILARFWTGRGWRGYDEVTDPDTLTRLHALTRLFELPTAPRFLVYPDESRTDAMVFGTGRRVQVLLGAGLLGTVPPGWFSGTIRHELGHVRNRDSGPTYLTIAAWRAFVVLVVLPYLVSLVVPGVFGAGPDAPRWNGHMVAAVIVLVVLVYLTRASVLRARETLADVTAHRHDPDGDLAAMIRSTAARRRLRWNPLAPHPPTETRLDALTDPAQLVGPGAFAMFAAGVGMSLTVMTLVVTGWVGLLATGVISASGLQRIMLSSPGVADALWLVIVSFGPATVLALVIAAGFAAVLGWRDAVLLRHTGRSTASWRRAVPVAVGFMVGEPLATVYADAGTVGVFDATTWGKVLDVGISTVGLALILTLLFRWARETAFAWSSATSLRRSCLATAAWGVLGLLPPMSIWVSAHNTFNVRLLTAPDHESPALLAWPAAKILMYDYAPLSALVAVPGVALLPLAACLFTLWGARERPFRAALLAAAWVAAVTVVVLLAGAWVVNLVDGQELYTTVVTVPHFLEYLTFAIIATMTVGALVAGVLSARRAGRFTLSACLLGSLVCVALVSLCATVPYYVAVCGPAAFTCMGHDWSHVGAVYSGLTVLGTGLATAACPIVLAVAYLLPRTEVVEHGGTHTARVLVALALFSLVSGLIVYSRVFLELW
ncbi:M48 family metalloprotease [Actinokineospora enzanensis]|uniref:M48 family metalloprotease n=1 Tax=Actinokineospora enzanensis TaxID=155975 RepID=UPI0003A6D59A|nr:M48 family metalloprotease [Actinokineospora enzanensis]